MHIIHATMNPDPYCLPCDHWSKDPNLVLMSTSMGVHFLLPTATFINPSLYCGNKCEVETRPAIPWLTAKTRRQHIPENNAQVSCAFGTRKFQRPQASAELAIKISKCIMNSSNETKSNHLICIFAIFEPDLSQNVGQKKWRKWAKIFKNRTRRGGVCVM